MAVDIAALLQMFESELLDFKSAQYQLGTSDEKGELCKDILAFANTQRATAAFIVIGVEEAHGRSTTVRGVTSHLKDADIQQLVNSNTSKPVAFRYQAVRHGGVDLGLIEIDLQQLRPLSLRNTLGKAKKNVVYVRRGSSTAEATPDEIVLMGTPAPLPAVPSTRDHAAHLFQRLHDLKAKQGMKVVLSKGPILSRNETRGEWLARLRSEYGNVHWPQGRVPPEYQPKVIEVPQSGHGHCLYDFDVGQLRVLVFAKHMLTLAYGALVDVSAEFPEGLGVLLNVDIVMHKKTSLPAPGFPVEETTFELRPRR